MSLHSVVVLASAAIAFQEVLADYEKRKSFFHRRCPFAPAEDFVRARSVPGLSNSMEFAVVSKVLQDTVKGLLAIQRVVRILALGLDYKKYSRFEMFAPHVYQTGNGKYHAEFSDNLCGMPKAAQEDVRFCIDYVIECSVKLKEFDYSAKVTVPSH